MHMNIAITFRLMITPVTPIVNRIAESARYHESCGSISLTLAFVLSSQKLATPRQRHRAHNRHQQQYRRDLKRQKIFREQSCADGARNAHIRRSDRIDSELLYGNENESDFSNQNRR